MFLCVFANVPLSLSQREGLWSPPLLSPWLCARKPPSLEVGWDWFVFFFTFSTHTVSQAIVTWHFLLSLTFGIWLSLCWIIEFLDWVQCITSNEISFRKTSSTWRFFFAFNVHEVGRIQPPGGLILARGLYIWHSWLILSGVWLVLLGSNVLFLSTGKIINVHKLKVLECKALLWNFWKNTKLLSVNMYKKKTRREQNFPESGWETGIDSNLPEVRAGRQTGNSCITVNNDHD